MDGVLVVDFILIAALLVLRVLVTRGCYSVFVPTLLLASASGLWATFVRIIYNLEEHDFTSESYDAFLFFITVSRLVCYVLIAVFAFVFWKRRG